MKRLVIVGLAMLEFENIGTYIKKDISVADFDSIL